MIQERRNLLDEQLEVIIEEAERMGFDSHKILAVRIRQALAQMLDNTPITIYGLDRFEAYIEGSLPSEREIESTLVGFEPQEKEMKEILDEALSILADRIDQVKQQIQN